MGEIDFLLDKVARTLDELRMTYKTKGLDGCGDAMERFDEAQEQLVTKLNMEYESQ